MELSPDICLNFKGEVLRDSPRLVDGQQQPQFATVIQPRNEIFRTNNYFLIHIHSFRRFR
jgi:hypothetical protein